MNVSWAQNQLKVTKLLQGKEPGQPDKKLSAKVPRTDGHISHMFTPGLLLLEQIKLSPHVWLRCSSCDRETLSLWVCCSGCRMRSWCTGLDTAL